MCGRFFVDDETWNEIEKIAHKIDREKAQKGDVRPSNTAFVLQRSGSEIAAQAAVWGYKAMEKGGLLFNARSETAGVRPIFRYDYESRRCVIPAGMFYEWKMLSGGEKQQHAFYMPGESLFLAGIYHRTPEGDRFVVLTREADGCMKGIHPRMPVILRQEDIRSWLFSKEEADRLVSLYLEELQRRECVPEYQQMRLSF